MARNIEQTKAVVALTTLSAYPRKMKRLPIFDYEGLLYKALLQQGYLNSDPSLHSSDPKNAMYSFKEKNLWVKKATGLEVTEFMLRFMAWLCLRNDDYSITDKHGNITGEKAPIVSIINDNPKPKKSELPPSFQDMQRHGVRITGYTTTEDR